MKKLLFCVILIMFFAIGCGGGLTNMGPGGVTPSMMFNNVSYPNYLNPNMDHQIRISAEDIEIIGAVDAVATSTEVLGFVSIGNSGYGSLLDEARAMGGDGVMNVGVDTNYRSLLFFYTQVAMKLNATVYRYKDKMRTTRR